MVLLLSLLRVTTVVTLSVISYFHVSLVHLSFRLNKMMVNTNRKELLVRLLCKIITHDDMKCVIFCEELVTHVG